MIEKQKQNLSKILIAMLLFGGFFTVFIPTTSAGTPGEGMGWDDMTYEVTIGDSFSASVWGDATYFTGYTMWNLSWTAGKLNISHVTNGDSGTWGSWSLTGGINNASGWLLQIDALTGDGSNVTGNYTLFDLVFDAKEVGTTDLTFIPSFGQAGIVLLDDGGLPIGGIYRNASVTIYPAEPASLTATKYNYTDINLTFTPGSGGNITVIRGSTTGYPTSPTSDTDVYNGTLTKYNHTGLNPCETWFYSAWTYNLTNSIFSDTYQTAVATTECYTNFSFGGIVPTNQTQRSNCTSYNVPVNLTITNSKGHTFNWWINCSDGSSFSGTTASNGSKGGTMSGLDHNTRYYWNVTATDVSGSPDGHSASYWFTTGRGGGTSPGTPSSPLPSNSATSIPIDMGTFEVDVTDTDGDLLNVTFYWANGTVMGTDNLVASGGTATINPSLSLDYGTTYQWYVYSNDSCRQTRGPSSGYWSFTTDEKSADITKDCSPSITNASIKYIINITNDGEANLTNLVVNETLDTNVEFWRSVPARNGDHWWNINYLNVSNTTTILIWVNVTACANGTTISNSINVSNASGVLLDTATCGPHTIAFSISKTANSSVNWNTTHLNYIINVTNIGDIYLENVVLNETYDNNISYYSSNYAPCNTNTTFNLSGVAPGSAITLYIRTNTSYGLDGTFMQNESKVYNNVTVKTNQTTPEVTKNMYNTVGARTELLRIWYNRDIPDLFNISNQIFAVLGAIMILGTLLILVYIVNQSGGGNMFGGKEE